MHSCLTCTIALLVATLTGCAAAPSFDRNPAEMRATLGLKQPSTRSLADLVYKKIPTIPYKSANWTSADWEILDSSAQVFEFSGFKSYLLAYELPAVGRARRFSFISLPTTTNIKTRGVFNPCFRILNGNHEELSVVDQFSLSEDGTFEGTFEIPADGKFLLIHTTKEKLAQSGTFEYTSIEGGMTFTSTVANPMLPEGAFRIAIE